MNQPAQDDLIGQTIAQYKILDRIGQGGMGVVYRADDTSLSRTVAMKFLPPWSNPDEDAEKRFVHEAKAASALDHPNIATIHEVGRSARGQLYIVMGFYPGKTIEERIAEGPLDIDDAVDYAIQIASGLDRAREDGIIHRDIKPGNVIVTDRGLVKILDFGLAKMQDVTMTMGGVSLGTVAYMSPEQARNEGIDHRTDLWALGVVLYEMLAGRRPFAASYEAAILYAAANEPHDPIQEVRSEVPTWLATVVDRLLEKDPDRRFQTGADVVDALRNREAAVQTASPAAPAAPAAPSPQPDLSGMTGVAAQTGSHGMSAAQIGTLSAAQLGALSTALSGAIPTKQPANRAVLWGAGAAVIVILIAFMGWFMGQTGSASSATTEADQSRAREMHSRAMDFRSNRQFVRARAELEQALRLDPEYVEAWATLAAVDIAQQDYTSAVEHSRKAIALGEENAAAHYNLAFALEGLGRFDEALEAYRSSTDADPAFVPGYSAWGFLLIEQSRAQEALGVLTRGLEAVPTSPLNYLLLKNLGKAHLALGDPATAVTELEKSVGLNGGVAESMGLLAEAYEASGLDSQARDAWQRYVDLETDPAKRRLAQERL